MGAVEPPSANEPHAESETRRAVVSDAEASEPAAKARATPPERLGSRTRGPDAMQLMRTRAPAGPWVSRQTALEAELQAVRVRRLRAAQRGRVGVKVDDAAAEAPESTSTSEQPPRIFRLLLVLLRRVARQVLGRSEERSGSA